VWRAVAAHSASSPPSPAPPPVSSFSKVGKEAKSGKTGSSSLLFGGGTTSSGGNKLIKEGGKKKSKSDKMERFSFEVFGKVQGVYFRKHTKGKADELGVHGWVMNTKEGTVVGEAEGTKEKLDAMKTFLSTKGSPKSRIDKCDIKDRKEVEKAKYSSFDIRR